jgi:hypothetical protein
MQDCLCHDGNAIERAAGRGGGIDVARDIYQLLQQLHRDQQQRAGDGVQQAAEMNDYGACATIAPSASLAAATAQLAHENLRYAVDL